MSNILTPAFLFAWNPVKFEWPEIGEQSALVKEGGQVIESWSCASHKKVKKGDRAFFSVVGSKPAGIFASGHVTSEPFIGKNRKGREAYRVLIEFDVLLDPNTEPILSMEIIKMGKMEKQVWAPQASGISIKQEITEELEALWLDFLNTENKNFEL